MVDIGCHVIVLILKPTVNDTPQNRPTSKAIKDPLGNPDESNIVAPAHQYDNEETKEKEADDLLKAFVRVLTKLRYIHWLRFGGGTTCFGGVRAGEGADQGVWVRGMLVKGHGLGACGGLRGQGEDEGCDAEEIHYDEFLFSC